MQSRCPKTRSRQTDARIGVPDELGAAGPAELSRSASAATDAPSDGGIMRVHYAPCPVTVVCQARR